jgi:LysR family transcriptional regulator, nitrogen assimilation regulatory protein
MNLRQFHYFLGAVDAGSFSRAATLLRIAQPALSEQISNLEKELGVELLIRSQRGVYPTAAGTIFYRTARAMLKEIEHLKTALQNPDGLVGEVSLGLTSTFSGTFSGPIVSAVLAQHPRIRLNISDGTGPVHYEGLLRGTLDLALLHEDSESSGLQRQPLYQQQLFFVEPRSSDRQTIGTIRMIDMIHRPFVLPALPNPSRAVIENAFLALGTKPIVVAEANSRTAILSLVASGIGNSVIAWSGPPDPAFEWSLIAEPSISHDVSLCTARVLPRSETVEAVQASVQNIVMAIVRAPGWKGAVFQSPKGS